MEQKNWLESEKITAFFFTDRKRYADVTSVIKNLPKNSAVIFREYDLDEERREKMAREIIALCRKIGRRILIGKNLALARKLRADGVHFSDKDILPREIFSRQNRSREFIFSFACHNYLSVVKSRRLALDLVFVSPIFASKSHPDVAPLGLAALSKIVKIARVSVFALGGVVKKNIPLLRRLGVVGIGGIGIFT